jgi:ABC-type dipeptide/oligopeptide/nickel transport system ATPase component
MILIIVLMVIILFSWFILMRNHIKIDISSFFKPSIPLARGVFGVYCFTGKQGSGKTYSLNRFVRRYKKDKNAVIYSNVTLLNYDYVKITSIEHLLSLKDERNCFIIFDEIFTLMTKTTKFNSEIMEFLTQMRKQENIFLTTAQEWLELPMTFRRFVRVQVACRTIPLGRLGGVMLEKYYDATNMAWDNLQNEYIAPLLAMKVSKYEKRYMESYDTYERIQIMK